MSTVESSKCFGVLAQEVSGLVSEWWQGASDHAIDAILDVPVGDHQDLVTLVLHG